MMSQGRDGNLYSTHKPHWNSNRRHGLHDDDGGSVDTVYSFCALTSCDDGNDPGVA